MSDIDDGDFVKTIRESLVNKIIMTEDFDDKLALIGADLWLASNSFDIKDIDDFDNKLSSFNQIVKHPLYISMVNSLNVSQLVSSYMRRSITDEQFNRAIDLIPGVSLEQIKKGIGSDSKVELGKYSYACAKDSFNQLLSDCQVMKFAEDCNFAMDFSFSNNWQEDSKRLYRCSFSFLEISDKLKSISEKIRYNFGDADYYVRKTGSDFRTISKGISVKK